MFPTKSVYLVRRRKQIRGLWVALSSRLVLCQISMAVYQEASNSALKRAESKADKGLRYRICIKSLTIRGYDHIR